MSITTCEGTVFTFVTKYLFYFGKVIFTESEGLRATDVNNKFLWFEGECIELEEFYQQLTAGHAVDVLLFALNSFSLLLLIEVVHIDLWELIRSTERNISLANIVELFSLYLKFYDFFLSIHDLLKIRQNAFQLHEGYKHHVDSKWVQPFLSIRETAFIPVL